MDERAALLRNILAHPNDDAARMVYADWLDEHGEHDHAELIRLQVRDIPETERRAYDPEMVEKANSDNMHASIYREMLQEVRHELDALRQQQRYIIEHKSIFRLPVLTHPMSLHAAEWEFADNEYPDGVQRWGRAEIERGFVYSVCCDWTWWRNHADKVLTEHPIRHVWLTTEPDNCIWVANRKDGNYQIITGYDFHWTKSSYPIGDRREIHITLPYDDIDDTTNIQSIRELGYIKLIAETYPGPALNKIEYHLLNDGNDEYDSDLDDDDNGLDPYDYTADGQS